MSVSQEQYRSSLSKPVRRFTAWITDLIQASAFASYAVGRDNDNWVADHSTTRNACALAAVICYARPFKESRGLGVLHLSSVLGWDLAAPFGSVERDDIHLAAIALRDRVMAHVDGDVTLHEPGYSAAGWGESDEMPDGGTFKVWDVRRTLSREDLHVLTLNADALAQALRAKAEAVWLDAAQQRGYKPRESEIVDFCSPLSPEQVQEWAQDARTWMEIKIDTSKLSPDENQLLADHRAHFAQIPPADNPERQAETRLMYENIARLHSLHALKDDIDAVIELCDEFVTQITCWTGPDAEARQNPLHPLHRALVEAVIVTYGRVFGSTRDTDSLKTLRGSAFDLDASAGEPGVLHQALMEMRNKRVAHADGPLKNLGTTVSYSAIKTDDGPPQVGATFQYSIEHVTLNSEYVPQIRDLATGVSAALAAQIETVAKVAYPNVDAQTSLLYFQERIAVDALAPAEILARLTDFRLRRAARQEALGREYGVDERKLDLFPDELHGFASNS